MDFDWSFYYWAELLKVVVTSYDHGEAFYDVGRAFLVSIHFKVSVAFLDDEFQKAQTTTSNIKAPLFRTHFITQSRSSPRHFFTDRALLLAGALFEGRSTNFTFS